MEEVQRRISQVRKREKE